MTEEKYKFTVGDIYFSTDLGKCEVSIYTSNEDDANFHIENNNGVDICVKLSSPEYMDGSKHLNETERKELDLYLESTITNRDYENWHSPKYDISNWKKLVGLWSFENDSIQNTVKPNYLNLED